MHDKQILVLDSCPEEPWGGPKLMVHPNKQMKYISSHCYTFIDIIQSMAL